MPREDPILYEARFSAIVQRLEQEYKKQIFLKKEAAKIIDASFPTLQKLIKKNEIKVDSCGRITIGSLARYLCG
jgi:hypothetical protein